MKRLALILPLPLLLSGCAWAREFSNTHKVSGTVFLERGDSRIERADEERTRDANPLDCTAEYAPPQRGGIELDIGQLRHGM